MWEKDRCAITTVAPGLYEVSFGFFTRKKPSVQLLVNGEPVLSAVNSASYAVRARPCLFHDELVCPYLLFSPPRGATSQVHHSSGRLAAVGPHPAGNVTGLTLIDYIVREWESSTLATAPPRVNRRGQSTHSSLRRHPRSS